MKIIIVGGVAGGASAATRARRVNPNAEIVIYEKGPAISFANCGLPYHLGGEIKNRSKLLVADEHLFMHRFNIKVRTEHEVKSIDRQNKQISILDRINNKILTDSYDKLILSTGSELIKVPEVPYENENVFTLWSLNDLDKSLEYLEKNNVKNIAVVGAGFVGLEVVEQLKNLGFEVHLIELSPQVLGPLDYEMAKFIEEELTKNNIRLHLGNVIEKSHSEQNRVTKISLSSGKLLDVDALFLGIGVRPLSKLAIESEIICSKNAAVQVNDFYQTSDKDIYAVGDMAEDIFGPTNKPAAIPLAGPANRAGRIAGEHAASNNSQFAQKVFATSIVRVFEKAAASTGMSEKLCKRENIDYRVSYISASHHTSYFPGAKELIIKLIYSPVEGKILGAQITGVKGVDKRIDVISTLLHFGGTVYDLASLDLAYAPPYGSAKDPLHQSAFVSLNDLNKSPSLISPSENLNEFQLIDVRTEREREILPLKNAIIIEIDGDKPFYMDEKIKSLDPEKTTVVTCHSGKRAHIVASFLNNTGFSDVRNLTGGMMIRSRIQN